MKKTLSLALIGCILVLALAACGGGASSSQPASSSPPQASSTPVSSVAVSSAVSAESTVDTADLDTALTTMVEAAQLGNTINVSEIDLKAGGVNMDNVERFVGAESQLSAQNGGIVILIKTTPGMADAVATDMEKYRTYRMGNGDYEEFEDARNNTQNGILVAYPSKDIVVYAVSATGDTPSVSQAATDLFE